MDRDSEEFRRELADADARVESAATTPGPGEGGPTAPNPETPLSVAPRRAGEPEPMPLVLKNPPTATTLLRVGRVVHVRSIVGNDLRTVRYGQCLAAIVTKKPANGERFAQVTVFPPHGPSAMASRQTVIDIQEYGRTWHDPVTCAE